MIVGVCVGPDSVLLGASVAAADGIVREDPLSCMTRSERRGLGAQSASVSRAVESMTLDTVRISAKKARRAAARSARGLIGRLVAENRSLRRQVRELEVYRSLAYTDHLTGLYNRRYFEERLAEEIERARRTSTRLSVMVIDLDGFKEINDRLGHSMGDEVLRAVAERIRTHGRKFDVACRVGGDEFAILLPHADRSAALGVLSRLRKAMDRPTSRVWADPPPSVDFSAGIATFPEDGSSALELFGAADTRMYGEKVAAASEARSSTEATGDGRPGSPCSGTA